jgi:hypothetical protein
MIALSLSIPLMDDLWKVPRLADQIVNRLIECHCEPLLIDARHCTCYPKALLKTEQWELKGDGLPNGDLS